VLVGVIVVLEAVSGVLGISKRVEGVATERMPLRLRISLQVGVLGGGEVSRGGIVWVRSYIDISNIYIIKIRILYLLSRRSS
jgi:hypothetical protein